jgi:hypothetical protein
LKEAEVRFFRFLHVKTNNLKKWHPALAGLITLIVVFLLSYIDRLLFLFFLAPWIPLFLVLIDALHLLYRRQLVPIAVILIWLISLTLSGAICLFFRPPEYFFHLHNYVYLFACLLCIIVNILMVIREPSRFFVAGAKILVFLCTISVLASVFFGDPGLLISLWVWSVFVIAPILGIIHHLRLLYTGNLKKPIGSIAVICILSIPLIIGAIHIWTLYMPSVITSEKFDLYGKWLEWFKSWD